MTAERGKSGDLRRNERLKAALRENLRRRKAQGKARAQGRAQAGGGAAEHDSAGIAPEIARHKPKGGNP